MAKFLWQPIHANLLASDFFMGLAGKQVGRDSSLDIATCYGLGDPGIESR
jgi:hypothetical protein